MFQVSKGKHRGEQAQAAPSWEDTQEILAAEGDGTQPEDQN